MKKGVRLAIAIAALAVVFVLPDFVSASELTLSSNGINAGQISISDTFDFANYGLSVSNNVDQTTENQTAPVTTSSSSSQSIWSMFPTFVWIIFAVIFIVIIVLVVLLVVTPPKKRTRRPVSGPSKSMQPQGRQGGPRPQPVQYQQRPPEQMMGQPGVAQPMPQPRPRPIPPPSQQVPPMQQYQVQPQPAPIQPRPAQPQPTPVQPQPAQQQQYRAPVQPQPAPQNIPPRKQPIQQAAPQQQYIPEREQNEQQYEQQYEQPYQPTGFNQQAPMRPEFVITNLTILPNEVKEEEPVTISATVVNTSRVPGHYSVVFKINHVVENIAELMLGPGASQTATFTVTEDEEGEYLVEADSLQGTFEVLRREPAAFSVTELTINPERIKQGQNIAVNFLVTNTGERPGSYTANLMIKGLSEATEEISLEPGETKSVTFNIVKDTAGFYPVTLAGMNGRFVVEMDWTGT
jgi:hypothetical protein